MSLFLKYKDVRVGDGFCVRESSPPDGTWGIPPEQVGPDTPILLEYWLGFPSVGPHRDQYLDYLEGDAVRLLEAIRAFRSDSDEYRLTETRLQKCMEDIKKAFALVRFPEFQSAKPSLR